MADVHAWSAAADGEVCVCGVGARTPLGYDATASAAAVRGSISAIEAHPFFVDKGGRPMNVAVCAGVPPHMDIGTRLKELLVSAVSEASAVTRALHGEPQMECWIGLPEPRPGLPSDIGSMLRSAISDVLGLDPSAVNLLARGHAAGLMAMQAAVQRISSGHAHLSIAAAVDSYHDPDTLEWLDRSGWLMSAGNRNGFPPGEGAGACVLASRLTTDQYSLAVDARVIAACTAVEAETIRGTGVCVGRGLTLEIQGVTSAHRLPDQAISATYCDLNGERYRSEEFAYTLLRVQEAFVDAHDFLCPADCWGDVGAASGPLFAALAVSAGRRGYAKGSYPLLWSGSENGYRTAVSLQLCS